MIWKRRQIFWLALAAVLAPAVCFGWRWYTTPALPDLPLERMEKAVAETIAAAAAEVRRQPRAGEAWGTLAMALAINGYHDRAITCFEHAEHFAADDPRWPYLHGETVILGDPEHGLLLLRQALTCATANDQRATICFRLALILIDRGALAEAESFLHELAAIEPDGPRLHFASGLLDVARGAGSSAGRHFKRLLENPYACKRANAQLAALALADGDAEAGRIFQRRAAQLPADLAWADPFFEEMKPFGVSRQGRLEQAARLERIGRAHEAVRLLRQVVADMPDAASYLALGLTLTRLSLYVEAESALRTAIDLGAERMQAQHVLATIVFIKAEKLHGQAGGKEKSLELFGEVVAREDRALALKSDYPFAHLTRGRALAYLRRNEDALKALRAAVLCGPEFADTHYYLGKALAESGNITQGLTHLENASRLAAPDDPRPGAALAKWRHKGR